MKLQDLTTESTEKYFEHSEKPYTAFYTESVYKFNLSVIPAKAGIHYLLKNLDSRLRGNDEFSRICEFVNRRNIKEFLCALCGLRIRSVSSVVNFDKVCRSIIC